MAWKKSTAQSARLLLLIFDSNQLYSLDSPSGVQHDRRALLRPLPIERPDEMVRVGTLDKDGRTGGLPSTTLDALGIGPDDDWPNTKRVAVITGSLWHDSFGGRPDALGRTIRSEDGLFTIVGVKEGPVHWFRRRLSG
jgi:hypothetical protein